MFAVILCTAPPTDAERLARTLVGEKLVACVNTAPVNSFFKWEGKLQEEKEVLLIMKTTAARVREAIVRIRELHSYQVPEIIALPIIDGYEGYLDWVKESVD
ncbi:MAG: divalent-cation tolerance protein CutA [Chloroflexi bacterium]|nr:divalent-cation tolerance protein CutA [Chloroflexota bacterium]